MFKYAYPEHFWLIAAIPVALLLWIWWWRWRSSALSRLGNTETVLPAVSKRHFWIKGLLWSSAVALLAIAWANPQMGKKKRTETQESSDIFIALDISQSMLCEDVAPNRLELSKIYIQKLVQKLEGERVGLIFFAGTAFLQMPLSSDYAFIFQSIQSASPDLLTEQGTDIAAAIQVAQKSFDPEPGGGRMLVIFSDGETHDEGVLDAAEDAFRNGTLIYTIGAGTESGGPIPTGGSGDGQYKRDENNELIRTRLEESNMQKIALSGGGESFNIRLGDAFVTSIKNTASGLQKRTIEVRSFADYESRYQWFLFPAILFLVFDRFISYKKS